MNLQKTVDTMESLLLNLTLHFDHSQNFAENTRDHAYERLCETSTNYLEELASAIDFLKGFYEQD